MRRAMVTMRPFGGAPFTVGNPAVAGASSNGAGRLHLVLGSSAPHAGTLTSVQFYPTATGGAVVFAGTWDGTTLTVTGVSGTLSATSGGANTFATSISIPSGGFIGLWNPNSAQAGVAVATTGGMSVTLEGASQPTVGGTYTGLTSRTWLISLNGSGS